MAAPSHEGAFAISGYLSLKRIAVGAIICAEVVVFGLVAPFAKGISTQGLIVRPGTAVVEVADQTGPWGVVAVDKVVTPVPSWVVVQSRQGRGGPGPVLGVVHVPAGTTTGVSVALDPKKGAVNTLVVSIFSDRGQAGVFEYTPPSSSGAGGMTGGGGSGASGGGTASAPATATLDKPLFAGGKTVSVIVDETFRNGAPGIVHRVVER